MADSNPLAPVDHNPIVGVSNVSLRNEDFRQLLLTPRGGNGFAGIPQTPSRFAHLDPNNRNRFAMPYAGKVPIRKKSSAPAKPKSYEIRGSDGRIYIDRAAQRRDGIVPTLDGNPIDLATEEEEERVAKAMSIEESKYMGGDMEHTHLVKGLDIALLNKVQSEIEESERERQRKEQAAAASVAQFGKKLITTQDGRVQAIDAPTEFKTLQGRAIYKLFFESQRPIKTDVFLPGRMIFSFDLDPNSIQFVPTVIMRAKDDVNDTGGYLMGTTNPALIKQISQIVTYIKEGEEGIKRLKKKQKAEDKAKQQEMEAKLQKPPPPAHSQPISTASIFDDVDDSDYVPTRKVEPPGKPKPFANAPEDSMEVDQLGPVMGPPRPPSDSDNLGPVMGPAKPPEEAGEELGPMMGPAKPLQDTDNDLDSAYDQNKKRKAEWMENEGDVQPSSKKSKFN